MSKPTTIRLPDSMLKRVDRLARQSATDRATSLRRLIEIGMSEEETRRLLASYQEGKASAGQVCEALGLSAWELPDLLRRHGVQRNVTFEDWLGSARLLPR